MRCNARTRAGNFCKAFAMAGTKTCYLHSSPTAAKLAGSIGGRQRSVARHPADLQQFAPPTTAAEVRAVLAHTIIELRAGKVDAKVGNSIAVLCGTLLRAIGESDFEARLRAVEVLLQKKGSQYAWKT